MRRIIIGFLVFAVSLSLVAQQAANQAGGAVLQYFDDDTEVVVTSAEGFVLTPEIGLVLEPGTRIETARSSAEILLHPNGTIIKIAVNTTFTVKAVTGSTGGEFDVLSGKIRAVAARTTNSSYRFNTPTAVGGVRGTDFGIEVEPGSVDKLIVKEGLVDFTNNATGQTVSLADGQGADALSSVFEPFTLSAEDLAGFFSGLDFVQLNPSTVPGQETVSDTTEDGTSDTTVGDLGDGTAEVTEPDDTGETETPPINDELLENPLLAAIAKVLGIELGSVTLGGTTYGKLLLQPKIDTEDFKLGLFLPIIYKTNVFDPQDWYQPYGNNEWSFGTDQGEDVGNILIDIFRDLSLKIRYIELFEQGDPFFLKLGNLQSMTLGHGFFIGGYANDADFPAIRRLGINIGVDTGGLGIEALVNDLSRPELFGFRLLLRPAAPNFKLGFGISAATDISPVSDLPTEGVDAATTALYEEAHKVNPGFLNLGLDLDLPIIEGDVFALKFFTDFGGMIPYIREDLETDDGDTIAAGLLFDRFISSDSESLLVFKNYGLQSGFLGKVFFFDFRLEFQYYNGDFQPAFYGNAYDRTRSQQALDLIAHLKGTPDYYSVDTMGIFGKVSADVLGLFNIGAGYKWPWSISEAGLPDVNNPDYFDVFLTLTEDLMPFGIDISLGFERTHFRDMITDPDDYYFFDEFATFKGNVEIPLGNFFKIRVQVGTSVKRDSTGAIDLSTGKPIMAPSLMIETVL